MRLPCRGVPLMYGDAFVSGVHFATVRTLVVGWDNLV